MAELADVAHLLKRTSFVITPERIEELAALDWEAALNAVVNAATPPEVGDLRFRNIYLVSEYDDFLDLLNYETRRLSQSDNGLGERLLWCLHSFLTTSFQKTGLPALLFRQHKLLAEFCLGNFKTLIERLTIDVAMLLYLDGHGSTADNPNENFGRELLELFTLGKEGGYYTQTDVRAAALGLAGWYVTGYPEEEKEHFNPNRITAEFDPGSAFTGKLEFLGQSIECDGSQDQYKKIIQAIFAFEPKPGTHPAAEHIAKKLFLFFVLPTSDPASIARLGAIFHERNYNLHDLLKALFRNRFFQTDAARQARARFPIETLIATSSSFASPVRDFNYADYFEKTGQTLFDPPNVAGWAVGNRWLAALQTLSRARLGLKSFDLSPRNPVVRAIVRAKNPVSATLRALSLYDVSAKTYRELQENASKITDPQDRARMLLAIATSSPEFALT